ncbi:MAG: sensor histidine kinase [Chitinophagaceae bacterium]|nr:sensor histidine kinase [Chitinophagaceae bacterium]
MYLNLSPASWYLIGASILFICLFLLFLLFFFQVTKRQNALLLKEQKTKNEYEQQLLNTQIEIQEQTLKTISQEIHDNIGQVLSLAKLNLNTFENVESTINQTKINDTKQLVSKAINDLRDLSRSMHGDKIAELGLQESIANELKILENTGQFKTSLKITGCIYKLEPQKEMVLFRIVQEALNNIVKHAKAKNIAVQLIYDSEVFKLCITDDGAGFDVNALTAAQTGIGLKSMQNRAVLIGSVFNIASGKGTTITIELKK